MSDTQSRNEQLLELMEPTMLILFWFHKVKFLELLRNDDLCARIVSPVIKKIGGDCVEMTMIPLGFKYTIDGERYHILFEGEDDRYCVKPIPPDPEPVVPKPSFFSLNYRTNAYLVPATDSPSHQIRIFSHTFSFVSYQKLLNGELDSPATLRRAKIRRGEDGHYVLVDKREYKAASAVAEATD